MVLNSEMGNAIFNKSKEGKYFWILFKSCLKKNLGHLYHPASHESGVLSIS